MSITGNILGGWCAMKVAERNYSDPYVRWVLSVAVLVTITGSLVPLVPSLHGSYLASCGLLIVQNGVDGLRRRGAAHRSTQPDARSAHGDPAVRH